MKPKSFVFPVAFNLLGTMVGAGIFGLPIVFSSVGLIPGTVVFLGVLVLAVVLHLLFLDVITRVHGKHRLPGYAGELFGGRMYWIAFISVFLKKAFTLLAYVILGGTFLSMLSNGFGGMIRLSWFWPIVFWLIGSVIIFYGLRAVTRLESDLTLLLVAVILLTAVILLPDIRIASPVFLGQKNILFGLGIIFFSVMGITVLPEMREIAGKNTRQARLGVVFGTLFAGALSWLFGVSIAIAYPGVSGVEGIQLAFPSVFWWLVPILGLLAVTTSFLTIAQALKNMFHVDLGFSFFRSWLMTVFIPLLLFLFVSRDFLATVGFAGAVLTGINAFIVCLCAYRVLRRPKRVWIHLAERLHFSTASRLFLSRFWQGAPVVSAIFISFIILQHLYFLLVSFI